MNLQAIYVIWLRELKKFIRNKSRVIGVLAQSFLWLVVFGLGLNQFVSIEGSNYSRFIAPGIISMTLLMPSIMSGIFVLWDKQFGFLKEILVAPVSRTSIILGKTLGTATTSVSQGLLILFMTVLMGMLPMPNIQSFLLTFGIMVIASCGFVSVGLIIASLLADPHGFQLIMNVLIMPMFMLSGAFFPITNLPAVIAPIVMIDPMTYCVDAMRNVLIGVSAFPLYVSAGVIGTFSAGTILLAAYLFRRIQ